MSSDSGGSFSSMDNLFPIDDGTSFADYYRPDNYFIASNGTFLCYYDGTSSSNSQPIVKVSEDNSSTSNVSNGIDMAIAQGMSCNGSRIAVSMGGFIEYSDDNGIGLQLPMLVGG